MNKLIIPAVLVAAGLLATAAWPQTAAPTVQNKRYFTMPLEKDPTREVGLQSVTMPPGAGNEFHRHPGDQWTAVQEGEVTYTVKGQPPLVLKAGDSNYVPRGTIHRQQNLSASRPPRLSGTRRSDRDRSSIGRAGSRGHVLREIGRIFAALDPSDDGKVPFLEGNEVLFESIPVDAGAWLAFENSTLCEEVAGLKYGGLIGTYEEAWFEKPQLPALSALLERAGTAPREAQAFVTELAAFVRRAHTRGVGITLAIGG